MRKVQNWDLKTNGKEILFKEAFKMLRETKLNWTVANFNRVHFLHLSYKFYKKEKLKEILLNVRNKYRTSTRLLNIRI